MLIGLVVVAQSTLAAAQTIAVGGGYQFTTEEFSESSLFLQYLEEATVESRYRLRNAPMIDVSVGFPLSRTLSVQGGVSVLNQSAEARLTGRIPSPFTFGRLRDVEQPIDEVGHREIAVRGEIAWAIPFGDWTLTLSGGPAAVNVRQEFAVGITVRELAFPFDTLALDVGDLSSESGWAIGGTAAADLSWFPSNRFGVGVTGRFTGANVDLRSTEITAGGPAIVAGVRFRP